MDLSDYSTAIFKVINSDEELLRLLHYKPENKLDNPLDISKPNILDLPIEEKWEIIDDCIVNAPKFTEIQDEAKSFLMYYCGYGRRNSKNYLFSDQEFHFDVITPDTFQTMDRRNEKICDRINKIIFGKNIVGMGKMLPKDRMPINTPKGYNGYRLVYEFVSENY